VATASELWDLVVHRDGEDHACYGATDPLADAVTYWKQKDLRNPALLVFLGLDLGYQLAAYLARPNPNTCAYLLVERDIDVFWHMLNVVDISPLAQDPRYSFLIGVPESQLYLTLRTVLEGGGKYMLIRATHFSDHSYSYRKDRSYYRAFMVAFRDATNNLLQNIGNSPLDAFEGLRHMLLNLEVIASTPGLNQLFGEFAGRPGVVVATGPSLDKNYHLLREIQDRAIIIACDASLKFLLRNGIRPHLVASLERVPESVPFFDGLDPESVRETVLVTVPVVVPEVYAAYAGPMAILYRPVLQFAWLQNEKGTLTTGHSSANMAFKILDAMGCNPIVLVGQDLAYADDGSTHSSAAYWGKTIGTRYGEPFTTREPLGLGSLRDLV
jgi:hypothetical protein